MEKRVLVIDSALSSWSRCSVLIEEGYSVEVALTPDAGLQKLSARSHDVIILETPEAESWQLCEKIRRVSTRPIICISPNASIESSVKAIRAGADYFMRKPFGSLEFAARVESLLRRASVRRNTAGSLLPS